MHDPHVLQVGDDLCRGAAGALVVFGLDDRNSFLNLPHWIKEIKEYASDDVKIILAGNKCDLS